MKLVVGLGNPGKDYAQTRHNIGWRVVDTLLNKADSQWSFEKKFNAEICKHDDVLYCKPHTFMNLSGQAIGLILQYYTIALEDLIVIYDDKDLPFGTIRFRTQGSSGGHNGMNSIIDTLGTNEFARLRLGIAPEHLITDTAQFVLQPFNKAEAAALPQIIDAAMIELKKHL